MDVADKESNSEEAVDTEALLQTFLDLCSSDDLVLSENMMHRFGLIVATDIEREKSCSLCRER